MLLFPSLVLPDFPLGSLSIGWNFLNPSLKSADPTSSEWNETLVREGQKVVAWLAEGYISKETANPQPGDIVILMGFGNKDLQTPVRVAEHYAQFYRQGLVPVVVFAGGIGRGTRGIVRVFKTYLKENGFAETEWLKWIEGNLEVNPYDPDGEKVIREAKIYEGIFKIRLGQLLGAQIDVSKVAIVSDLESNNTGANVQNSLFKKNKDGQPEPRFEPQSGKFLFLDCFHAPPLVLRADYTLEKQFMEKVQYKVILRSFPSHAMDLRQMDPAQLLSNVELSLSEIDRIIDYQKSKEKGGHAEEPFITPVTIPEEVIISSKKLIHEILTNELISADWLPQLFEKLEKLTQEKERVLEVERMI